MSYSIRLSNFSGPLDLLLHLIEQAEVDINDIFVSEITGQYLAYMEQIDTLDMDTASEFLAMAATLLYIKSRQLLPKPQPEPVEEEEEDPAEALIRQLHEYKAFKAASGALNALYASAQDLHSRLPEDVPLPPQRFQIEGVSRDALYEAFLSILNKRDTEGTLHELHDVHQDEFTVRTSLKTIRKTLKKNGGKCPFEDLFPTDAPKMQVIVIFMSLLEMLAHGEVSIHQSGPFRPITVEAGDLLSAHDDKYVYMDEDEA